MTIIGINGKLRQGKGILESKIALGIADSGGRVKSNHTLQSPNSEKIDFYDFCQLLMKPRQTPQVTLSIDEIQGWLDSYVGQSKSGRFGSYFAFQSAKLGYSLVYTSQLNMRAMNTLRELCDFRVYAIKDAANEVFYYLILDPNEPDDDIFTGRYFTITYDEASKWWDRYDTYEPVTPLGIQELFTDLEKYDPERLDVTLNCQTKLILEKAEKDGVKPPTSRIGVKSWLISLKQPSAFADLVAFRISQQLCIDRQAQRMVDHIEKASTPSQDWKHLLSEFHSKI